MTNPKFEQAHAEAYGTREALERERYGDTTGCNGIKHTPTPWIIKAYDIDSVTIQQSETSPFEPKVVIPQFNCPLDSQYEANAHRIVASVNATEGVSTEALESGVVGELIDVLKDINSTLNQGVSIGWQPGSRMHANLTELLNKAKGGQ